MVDIETGRIVDLLESREFEDVSKWLKGFKNIKVISRDGSVTYKNASTNAHPEAIQVSDRFHILKNLTEYGKDYLKRLLNKQVLLSDESEINEKPETREEPNVINKYKFKTKWDLIKAVKELKNQGYRIIEISDHLGISPNTVTGYNKVLEKDKDIYNKLPMNNSKAEENKEGKWQLIQDVQKEYEKSHNLSKVAKKFNIDRRTVKKYLHINEPPIHASTGIKHIGKLDKYKELIIKMLDDRNSYKIIHNEIKEHGYNGSSSLLHKYIAEVRKGIAAKADPNHIIERSTLISLLFKEIDNTNNITKETFDKFTRLYPDAGQIYEIIKTFKEIVFKKKVDELDGWIEKNKARDIKEINSFINGIERDVDAVKNAIKYDYNNGLAEGTVNKIKVVKRIMYGRCGFELLRKKLLLL